MQAIGEWVAEQMSEHWLTAECYCPECRQTITIYVTRTDASIPLPKGPIEIVVYCSTCGNVFRAIHHTGD